MWPIFLKSVKPKSTHCWSQGLQIFNIVFVLCWELPSLHVDTLTLSPMLHHQGWNYYAHIMLPPFQSLLPFAYPNLLRPDCLSRQREGDVVCCVHDQSATRQLMDMVSDTLFVIVDWSGLEEWGNTLLYLAYLPLCQTWVDPYTEVLGPVLLILQTWVAPVLWKGY